MLILSDQHYGWHLTRGRDSDHAPAGAGVNGGLGPGLGRVLALSHGPSHRRSLTRHDDDDRDSSASGHSDRDSGR
jgi:hypothetical protein